MSNVENAERNGGNMSIGMHNEANGSKMFALTGWLAQFALDFRFSVCALQKNTAVCLPSESVLMCFWRDEFRSRCLRKFYIICAHYLSVLIDI